MTPLVVGIGGALGTIARYYLSDWMQATMGQSMPWGLWPWAFSQ